MPDAGMSDEELQEAYEARDRLDEQEAWDATCRDCACFGEPVYESRAENRFLQFSCAAGVDIEPQQWELESGEPSSQDYPQRCSKFNASTCA